MAENRFFKLPFHFDAALLEKDLRTCEEEQWVNHFNEKDYSGSWTSISLRSASGKEKDINAHSTDAAYMDTALLKKCAYFIKIVQQFHCDKESVRLLALAPHSEVKEHRDLQGGYPDGFLRLHIPIRTNPLISFHVDGAELPMKTGECWYANFSLPHSVKNNSHETRIHLVIDCKRNSWSDALFESLDYDFEAEKRSKDHSVETKKQMIEQLRFMKTPAAAALIRQLETEIAAMLHPSDHGK